MNKKDTVIKTIVLLVAVLFIGAVWYGFSTIDKQTSHIERLKVENERQEKQISFLEHNTKVNKSETINESNVELIQEASRVFVQSIFNIKIDNYKERKSNGETVLTDKLFQKIFTGNPKDLNYEYSLSDINSYVNQTTEDKASAYITFEQAVTNINNNKTEESYVTVQVFLQREGENWIVNEFKQINAEPL